MEKQGQPGGAQVRAVYPSDLKGWGRDPPLHRSHVRAGSRSEGISLETPVCVRPSEAKLIIALVSASAAAAFEHILTCCSLALCYSAFIAVLSIAF